METNLSVLYDYIQIKGLTKAFVPLLTELFNAQTKDGRIVLNASLKRIISKKIDLTKGSIDNMITQMVEAKIIIRLDRGMYVITNELDGLGHQYMTSIEMVITYNDGAKRIKINGGGSI